MLCWHILYLLTFASNVVFSNRHMLSTSKMSSLTEHLFLAQTIFIPFLPIFVVYCNLLEGTFLLLASFPSFLACLSFWLCVFWTFFLLFVCCVYFHGCLFSLCLLSLFYEQFVPVYPRSLIKRIAIGKCTRLLGHVQPRGSDLNLTPNSKLWYNKKIGHNIWERHRNFPLPSGHSLPWNNLQS